MGSTGRTSGGLVAGGGAATQGWIDASLPVYAGATDDVTVANAIAAGIASGDTLIWLGGKLIWNFHGSVAVPAGLALHFLGLSAVTGSPNGVPTVINLIGFRGFAFVLGTDDGKPFVNPNTSIQGIVGNGVTATVTFKAGHGIRSAATPVTIAGTTHFNGAANLTPTSAYVCTFPSAQNFTDGAAGNISMAAVNVGNWDGPNEGVTFERINCQADVTLRDQALVQGVNGSYASGAGFTRDWRSGSVTFIQCKCDNLDVGNWSVFGDQDVWDTCTYEHCHVARILLVKSGQCQSRHCFVNQCDFGTIVDSTNGFLSVGDFLGSSGAGPNLGTNAIGCSILNGSSGISCNGHVIDAMWMETANAHTTETVNHAAYWDIGIGKDAATVLQYPIDVASALAPVLFGVGANLSRLNNQATQDVTFRNPIVNVLSSIAGNPNGGVGKTYTKELVRCGRLQQLTVENPSVITGPMFALIEQIGSACDAPAGGTASANTAGGLRDASWTPYVAMAQIILDNNSGGVFGTTSMTCSFQAKVTAQNARPAASLFAGAGGTQLFDSTTTVNAHVGCWLWTDATNWYDMANNIR